MFDIGFWELLLIAIVALVVVGPQRLPKLVRVTGFWVGRANSSIQSIRSEISRELRAEELKQALNETVLEEPDLMDPQTIHDSKTGNANELIEPDSIVEPSENSDKSVSKDDNGKG